MTTQFITPDEAQKTTLCPLARTFGDDDLKATCRGPACALWRWQPLMASDPGYKEALVKARDMKAERGTMTAAEYVNANRADFGLPTEPFLGWCGLGGEPKA